MRVLQERKDTHAAAGTSPASEAAAGEADPKAAAAATAADAATAAAAAAAMGGLSLLTPDEEGKLAARLTKVYQRLQEIDAYGTCCTMGLARAVQGVRV